MQRSAVSRLRVRLECHAGRGLTTRRCWPFVGFWRRLGRASALASLLTIGLTRARTGKTLYDPNQNVWRDIGITGAAMGAGAYGLGEVLGGLAGSAAPGAAEMSVSTTPLGQAGVVSNAPSMAAGGGVGTVAPTVTAASAAAPSLLDRIKGSLTSPDGLASLAGIITSLAAGGAGGGGGASDEQMNALLEQAVRRTERTDPLHQAVTQLAFSRLPVSARNGIQLTGK
jgi:hypothetical protein